MALVSTSQVLSNSNIKRRVKIEPQERYTEGLAQEMTASKESILNHMHQS